DAAGRLDARARRDGRSAAESAGRGGGRPLAGVARRPRRARPERAAGRRRAERALHPIGAARAGGRGDPAGGRGGAAARDLGHAGALTATRSPSNVLTYEWPTRRVARPSAAASGERPSPAP